jgi:hypothetical protein
MDPRIVLQLLFCENPKIANNPTSFYFQVSPRQPLSNHQSAVAECRQFESPDSGKVKGVVMFRISPTEDWKHQLFFYEVDVKATASVRALWLSLEKTSESSTSAKLVI